MNLFQKRRISETFEARTRREQLEQLKARYPNARWNTPDTFEYVVQTRFGALTMSVHLPEDFPDVAPVIRVLSPVQHPWVNPSGFLSYCPKIMTWQKGTPDVNSLLTFIAHQFQANPPAPAGASKPPAPVAAPAAGGYPGLSVPRANPNPYRGAPSPVPPPPASAAGAYNPYGGGYSAAGGYSSGSTQPPYTSAPPYSAGGYPTGIPPPPAAPAYTASPIPPPPSAAGPYNPSLAPLAPGVSPAVPPRSPALAPTPAPVPVRPIAAPLERRVVEEMTTERLKALDNDQALVRSAVHDLPELKTLDKQKEALEHEISVLHAKLASLEESNSTPKDDSVNYVELLKQEIDTLTQRRQLYAATMGKFSVSGVCGSLDEKANAAAIRAEDILERMGQATEGELGDILEEYMNAQKEVHINHILASKVKSMQR